MSKVIGKVFGKEKHVFLYKESNEFVLPDTDLGVEVEVEHVNPRSIPQVLPESVRHYWDHHEDNSLHDRGMEFTFKAPMFGEDAAIAIKDLLQVAKSNLWVPSLRTGIHVHMDARDLTSSQLLGFLAYYIILEPCIYNWIGEDRHANNFCIPWYKSQGSIDSAVSIVTQLEDYSKEQGELSKSLACSTSRGFHRYAGLNLKALSEYGSVEFRQLKTTLEWEQVRDWINIILNIKRQALEVPESTLTIVNGITRRGIVPTLEYIFGNKVSSKMLDPNGNVPDVLDLVKFVTIPNAVEFIGEVTKVRGNSQEYEWNPSFDVKKINHPGFNMWRAAAFPKGLSKNQKGESQPPKKKGRQLQFMDYVVPQPAEDLQLQPPQEEGPPGAGILNRIINDGVAANLPPRYAENPYHHNPFQQPRRAQYGIDHILQGAPPPARIEEGEGALLPLRRPREAGEPDSLVYFDLDTDDHQRIAAQWEGMDWLEFYARSWGNIAQPQIHNAGAGAFYGPALQVRGRTDVPTFPPFLEGVPRTAPVVLREGDVLPENFCFMSTYIRWEGRGFILGSDYHWYTIS